MERFGIADSHFTESADTWHRYMEPEYRELRLRFVPPPDSDW